MGLRLQYTSKIKQKVDDMDLIQAHVYRAEERVKRNVGILATVIPITAGLGYRLGTGAAYFFGMDMEMYSGPSVLALIYDAPIVGYYTAAVTWLSGIAYTLKKASNMKIARKRINGLESVVNKTE